MSLGDCGVLFAIGPAPDKQIELMLIVYKPRKATKTKGNYSVILSPYRDNPSLGPGAELWPTTDEFNSILKQLKMKYFKSDDYTAEQMYKIAKKMKADVPEEYFKTVYARIALKNPCKKSRKRS